MKYRLDEDHYDEFIQLPAGTEVGDGCEVSWKYPNNVENPALRGKHKPPSRSMTPLDAEARAAYEKHFKQEPSGHDHSKAAPIFSTDPSDTGSAAPDTGNTFTGRPIAPPNRPNPALNNPTEKSHTGVDPTKDDSVAKEDPYGNKTPVGHKPSESIPAGKK